MYQILDLTYNKNGAIITLASNVVCRMQ